MTIIKTITQEHLESTLLSISNSYEQEMTSLISKYRDGDPILFGTFIVKGPKGR